MVAYVFSDIVKTFKKSLSHIDWMDEKSAKAAADKVEFLSLRGTEEIYSQPWTGLPDPGQSGISTFSRYKRSESNRPLLS